LLVAAEAQAEVLVGCFGVRVVEVVKSLLEPLRCQEMSLSLSGKVESNQEIAIQLARRVVLMAVILCSLH
jgi:hypothetical protein